MRKSSIKSEFPVPFAQNYQCLLNRLKLHGLQPKTIALYSHGVRRAGAYFDYRIDALTKPRLTGYFVHIIDSLSWNTLKHDLYGLKLYYAHVLEKPWPDIVTVQQVQQIFMATQVRSISGVFLYVVQSGFALGRRLAFSGWGY